MSFGKNHQGCSSTLNSMAKELLSVSPFSNTAHPILERKSPETMKAWDKHQFQNVCIKVASNGASTQWPTLQSEKFQHRFFHIWGFELSQNVCNHIAKPPSNQYQQWT
ncbi:MAG: hypothetical protein R2788_22635 [Saprospiraceae bacterium]